MTCLITGVVGFPDGSTYPNAYMYFERIGVGVVSQGGAVVIPEKTIVRSDGSANVSFSLLYGVYQGTIQTTLGDVKFKITVPDDPTADFGFIIGDFTMPIYDGNVQLVLDARDDTVLAAGAAAASAAQAALYDGPKVDTFAELASVTPSMLDVGEYIRVVSTGAVYQRVSSGGHLDYSGAGGVRLNVLAGADGSVVVSAFSASLNHTAIQAAINFFGTSRGKVQLAAGVYSCTASIDFKRVALNGVTVADGGQSGGTTLSFSGAFGLYSSIEDNQCPHHSNFRIRGSAEKTANGQTLIDFTGLNYPRLTNVISYAAENGMKLAPGTVVECHYGSFVNYDASRCYRDVLIEGNVKTQSHSFFGGRSWDCVFCATNNGTEDVNFFGRQFEGGLFPDHLANGASTKTFGCRFEGLTVSESPLLGSYQSLGDYTSGWQHRPAISFASGVATRNTARSVIGAVGADGAAISGPANLLRNPSLILDVNDPTKIAGWSAPAVTYTRLAGITGPILKGVAASSFFGFEQFGLDMPAGDYTVGFFIQRDDADVGFFSIILQLLDSAGVVINDSAGGGTDFNASNFTAISGNHRGNVVVRRIKLTTPRTNVRFRAAANGATGRTVYFGTPFLFFGHSGISPSISEPTFGRTLYGTAAPSAGTYRIGDIAHNTTPTAGGVMGWVCTTAGSPGTWKTFGAITP